jgi:hypothetical protein
MTTLIRLSSLTLLFATVATHAMAQSSQGPPEDGERRGPPHGEGHRPPQEAFDVCAEAGEGDACAVNTPHGTLEGTCLYPPVDNEPLVCVPDHHRQGGPPPQ